MAQTTETQEPRGTELYSLPPLASTIRTFVGRDEHDGSPAYSRLEYMTEAEQTGYVPNIIKGLITRLQETHPEYTDRLNQRILENSNRPSQEEPGDEPSEEPDLDPAARGQEEAPDQRTQYQVELDERLARATSVHEFAGAIMTASLFNQRTHQPSEQKMAHQLKLAQNMYSEDPLVSLSREAATILSDDDLARLGKLTVGAAVAVVEYAGLYNERAEQAVRQRRNTPDAAA